jgi:hypothetical protein
MTRLSGDEIRRGGVWNGFDYELQVWVIDGIIQRCGHPATMRFQDRSWCNAYRLAGRSILDVLPNAQRKDGLDDMDSLTEVYGISQAPSRKTS